MLKDAQVPEEAFLLENIMRTDVIKMATQSHANISSKGVLNNAGEHLNSSMVLEIVGAEMKRVYDTCDVDFDILQVAFNGVET